MAGTPNIKWSKKHVLIGAVIVAGVYYLSRHAGNQAMPTELAKYNSTNIMSQAQHGEGIQMDTSRYV